MEKLSQRWRKHRPDRVSRTLLALVVGSALIALSLVPSPAAGGVQAADVGALASVDDYVTHAIAHNPKLAAARARASAYGELPDQRGALPNPKLGVGYFIETPETRVGPQQAVVTLSQQIPFFGKRGLRSDIAEREAGIAAAEYGLALIDLVYNVKTAYHEFVRLQGVRHVWEEEKQVLVRMQEVAGVKYAAGQVGQQDVLKAQLELSQVEDELTTNRRDLVTVTARLAALLNLPPSAELAPPPPASAPQPDIEKDMERLYEVAERNRPELQAAALEVERTGQARALAKKEYFPDLTIGAQYVDVGKRDIDIPDNGKDIWQVAAVIDLPLWFGRLGAGVREAEAQQARARSERAQVETTVRSQIRDAVERVNAAVERVRLYETVIVPQAEQSFLSAESGYRTGNVDFLRYLDSERVLLSVRKKQIGVIAELGKQRAYLERVLGSGVEYEKNTEDRQ